ncbi:MAG: hypothetical protein KGL39_32190, partial [Patescibacteria group bacterium]|nr:hypothetical protein [Patescibacteria group bacterium]
ISGGVTGYQAPNWPAYPGAIVLDGTAQWKASAVSTGSLDATVQSVSWTANANVSLSIKGLVGQISLLTADTTNCVSGTDYDLNATATLSTGAQLNGKIRLKVY